MSGLFGARPPKAVPVPDIADTQNRMQAALTRRLAGGGSNADTTSNSVAPTGGSRSPTLTGLN